MAGCIYAITLQRTVILIDLGSLEISIPSREEPCLASAMPTRQALGPNGVPPGIISKRQSPPPSTTFMVSVSSLTRGPDELLGSRPAQDMEDRDSLDEAPASSRGTAASEQIPFTIPLNLYDVWNVGKFGELVETPSRCSSTGSCVCAAPGRAGPRRGPGVHRAAIFLITRGPPSEKHC